MKKTILLAVLAVFTIIEFNSCSKVANLVAQSISWQGVDVSFTVAPVSDTAAEHTVGAGSFRYDLDSFLKAKTGNLLALKNVDTFRITGCTLTITQNADASNNFQNFQMAKASFYTSANTTLANLGEIDNNPDSYATTLSLPVNSNTNLKSYIPNSGAVTMYYVCSGKLRKATTATLTVNAHIEYYIHLTP